MPPTLTADQILALAPDPASAKAGQGLASPRKWSALGYSERAAWGQCQGSAREPYQTEIDLSEPAFHCSCPSRKFPCKHTIRLFLLFANRPELFSADAKAPDWLTTWLDGRQKRREGSSRGSKRNVYPGTISTRDPSAFNASSSVSSWMRGRLSRSTSAFWISSDSCDGRNSGCQRSHRSRR